MALVIGTTIFMSGALPTQADGPSSREAARQRALGAVASAQTSTNNSTITSIEGESVGTETASGGGVAVAGPAVARSRAIVVQRNIQVDPFNAGTQTATNEANVNQMTGAASGDATGTNGGMAMSGPAVATSIAVVVQVNVQVIACPFGSGAITQDASNVADIDQDVLAVSGNADADGSGSTARSGRATARSVTRVNQRNVQVETCN